MIGKLVKLGEYIDILSGYAFKSKDFCKKGIPVVKIKDINPPYVNPNTDSYVPKSFLQAQAKYLLEYDDILIAMTGSHISQWNSVVGRTAKVKYKTPSFLNQRVGKLICKNSQECNINYIYYFLTLETTIIRLANVAGGAANQANISPTDIKNLEIELPDIEYQNKVVNILYNIDNLIECNCQQIKLLEEAAQRLYKEWFIDLHFPGYENTPIVDGVPEGWTIVALGNLISRLESGSRPKGGIDSTLKTGVPSIGAENILGLGQYNYSSEKLISDEFFQSMKRGIIQNKDILIYKDGAYIGRTSLFQDGFPHKVATINEHVFLLHSDDEHLQYYLFFTLNQKEYYDKMQKLNKNAAQPGLNQKAIQSIHILLPNENLTRKFDNLVAPLVSKIFALANQNRNLSEARDLLLPRLMSGEITV